MRMTEFKMRFLFTKRKYKAMDAAYMAASSFTERTRIVKTMRSMDDSFSKA